MSDLFNVAIFLKFFAALFALLNPLYGIPIFLSLTSGFSPEERRRTAVTTTLAVTVTALVSLLVGEEILGFFGISVPSFRIAGGIIILGISLAMLNAKDTPPGEQTAVKEAASRRNIAVVPLAIPLTIGPGAIATTIVFSHQLDTAAEIVTLVPVVLAVCAMVGIGLLFAAPIDRFLGATVINVVSRIMAIILAAVAVEMIVLGIVATVSLHFPQLSATVGS